MICIKKHLKIQRRRKECFNSSTASMWRYLQFKCKVKCVGFSLQLSLSRLKCINIEREKKELILKDRISRVDQHLQSWDKGCCTQVVHVMSNISWLWNIFHALKWENVLRMNRMNIQHGGIQWGAGQGFKCFSCNLQTRLEHYWIDA